MPPLCISITRKYDFCYMLHILMGREILLLCDFPPVFLFTYGDAEAGPDAV